MDRKEFFKQVWIRFLRPVLNLIVILYTAKFVVDAFKDDGHERFISLALLAVALFFLVVTFLNRIIMTAENFLFDLMPEKAKFWLRVFQKAFEYVSILFLGAMLYIFWTKDAFLACIFAAIYIADRVSSIVKQEKLKLNS